MEADRPERAHNDDRTGWANEGSLFEARRPCVQFRATFNWWRSRHAGDRQWAQTPPSFRSARMKGLLVTPLLRLQQREHLDDPLSLKQRESNRAALGSVVRVLSGPPFVRYANRGPERASRFFFGLGLEADEAVLVGGAACLEKEVEGCP